MRSIFLGFRLVIMIIIIIATVSRMKKNTFQDAVPHHFLGLSVACTSLFMSQHSNWAGQEVLMSATGQNIEIGCLVEH